MQKYIYSCIAMILMLALHASAQDATYADNVAKYVARYKNLAIAEQKRSGVPAAITLGQGILETEAGCSVLVTGANNHFGIKCRKEWTGETFAHTDDAPNECFRKYSCADDSYKDHSDYLKNSPRYASLFTLSKTDYPAWAMGLKRCGYATNPHYAQQLIKIIEDFKLQEYTYAAMNSDLITQAEKKEILDDSDAEEDDTIASLNKTGAINDKAKEIPMSPAPLPQAPLSKIGAPEKGGVINMNGLKAIYGYKGDMLLQYAIKYKMRYAHLLEINDLPDAPLASNMYIYLERKNTKGTHETHIVKPGESLLQIAQLEGIQLRRLMVLNRLNIDEEPIAGTVLQLQQFADAKPLLAAKTSMTKPLSKIVVRNSDDFIATNKQPAETVPSTPIADKQVQPIVASATVPAAAIAAAKEPEMEAVKPAETNMQVAETASVNDDKKFIESKPVITAPAQSETHLQATVVPTPVTPINDDSKIIENKPAPVIVPAQNTAVAQKVVSAPENDTKKVVEAKSAPVVVPVQNTAPVQTPTEPMDDLARLKAQLDKVVYTGNEKPAAPAAAHTQQSNAVPTKAAASDDKYYTVKKGDTAFNIAKQHNITMHQLMDWNDLNFDEIKTGQRLRVKE